MRAAVAIEPEMPIVERRQRLVVVSRRWRRGCTMCATARTRWSTCAFDPTSGVPICPRRNPRIPDEVGFHAGSSRQNGSSC